MKNGYSMTIRNAKNMSKSRRTLNIGRKAQTLRKGGSALRLGGYQGRDLL